MQFILPCLAALASTAAAVGNALVLNNSTSTIYAWSVSSSVGPRQTIVPGRFQFVPLCWLRLIDSGGLYMEPFHRDPQTGGIAIKITRTADGLFNGDPQQVFAYNLDGAQVWYDLSSVFGDAFIGQRVEVTSDSGGSIVWPNGTHPSGSQVKVASSDENVWFTVYGSR